MNKTITLTNEAAKKRAKLIIDSIPPEAPPHEVIIREHKRSRSADQNALSHAWYAQVSRKEGEYLPGEIKRLCKYHFGLPILRADDAEFNHVCNVAIDVLAYEDKIKAMEYLPVTSRMTTTQLSEYLKCIQKHYAGRVCLEFPGDMDV